MRFFSRALTSLAAVLCVLLIGGTPTAAQTLTTGSVGGVVTDQQGGVLPGATVTAVHTPTGTSYEGVTDAEGRFSITLLDGVPYEVFAYGEVGEHRLQVRTPRRELIPSEGTRPLKLVIPR